MEPKHVHHSYVWLGAMQSIFWILFTLTIILVSSVGGELSQGLDIAFVLAGPALILAVFVTFVLIIAGLVFLIRWLSWKHLTYQCQTETFEIRKGILFKKAIHIPYERIQGIDQKMSLLQRLLGLCTVKIDTAAGSENESADLPYLTKADAEALRAELITRKALILQQRSTASNMPVVTNPLDAIDDATSGFSGVFSAASVQTEASYQRRLSTKELLMACATNANSAFGSAIAAFFLFIAGLSGSIDFIDDFVGGAIGSMMNSTAESVATMATHHLLSSLLPSLILGALGIMLIVWLVVVAGSAINLGGFAVRRVGDRAEIEHGLLSRTYRGINIARIQSIHIKQGLVRRYLGYCEVSVGKIEGAATEGENQSTSTGKLVLHPFLKADQLDEFLDNLIPEISRTCTVGITPAPVAKRRAILRQTIFFNVGFWCMMITVAVRLFLQALAGPNPDEIDQIILIIVDIVSVPLMVLFAIDIVLGIPRALLWFKQSQVAFGQNAIRIVNGGLTVKTDILPRKKVQSFSVRSNPLQRLAKVQTITATSAAGTGEKISLRDAGLADADAWYGWMKPRS